MTWNWTFAWSIVPRLAQGLGVTLLAVLGGMCLALITGLVWTVLRRSSRRYLRWPTSWLVEFVRSTPLLVQLYFCFYVLPHLGLTFSPLFTGIFVLGFHYSCYTTEVYRAGLESIPVGQWYAAKALHLTPWQTYRYILFPQVIPPSIPALGNYLIAMFKDTPMLSAITVLEILQRAKIIGKESFRFLEPLTLVGLTYLLLSLLSSAGLQWLERKLKVEHTR